jgi:hypothetical protein
MCAMPYDALAVIADEEWEDLSVQKPKLERVIDWKMGGKAFRYTGHGRRRNLEFGRFSIPALI